MLNYQRKNYHVHGRVFDKEPHGSLALSIYNRIVDEKTTGRAHNHVPSCVYDRIELQILTGA